MRRLAVIGIGSWGSRVAREAVMLLKEGALSSVCICEMDQKRIDSFKNANADLLKGLDGIKYYNDVDKTIKDGIDFAHICTQNSSHFEISKKMILHKIPFVVEKPVSDKAKEVEELEALCKKSRIVAKNGLIFRFDNSIKEIRKLYSDGSLGEVHFIKFYWEFSRDYMEGVDIVWDLMPHLVDMFYFITGEKSSFAGGFKTQFRRKSGAELATIILKTDSGIKGIFNISWFSTRKNRIIEIFGDRKVLNADLLLQSITLYDAKDISRSETISIVKNNTIRDELLNLITDAESGKNTVNNIEIGIEVAKYLDIIDRKATDV